MVLITLRRLAVAEILEIGESLRKGKLRIKDVVRDLDKEEDVDFEGFTNIVGHGIFLRPGSRLWRRSGTPGKVRD